MAQRSYSKTLEAKQRQAKRIEFKRARSQRREASGNQATPGETRKPSDVARGCLTPSHATLERERRRLARAPRKPMTPSEAQRRPATQGEASASPATLNEG